MELAVLEKEIVILISKVRATSLVPNALDDSSEVDLNEEVVVREKKVALIITKGPHLRTKNIPLTKNTSFLSFIELMEKHSHSSIKQLIGLDQPTRVGLVKAINTPPDNEYINTLF